MKKQGKQNTNSTDFCTVWKVKAGGVIKFNALGSFTIDWGDGCIEQGRWEDKYEGLLMHTYVKKGEYTVSIGPGVTRFWLGVNSVIAKKMIEIKQWGAAQWENMNLMFDGARIMICTATDKPDMSKVESMVAMFRDCKKFNSPIEHWDTKRVKDMRYMLFHAWMFNRSLANMDLKAIEEVDLMLEDTPAFNQDLRGLNIGAKVDTDNLFGWHKSLAQYNLEQAERYAVQEEKQDVYNVLDGAGACRML